MLAHAQVPCKDKNIDKCGCYVLKLFSQCSALCAESEVRKAVERSSYAVALKFRVFFLLLKSVKF